MEIKIENRPSYAIAKIELTRKEKINAETNTLVSMTNGIKIETKVIEGENLFVNTFEALNDYEELILAPASVGDIDHINLDGAFYLQSKSYLASGKDITIDTQWSGSKTFFSKEDISLLKASGKGELVFSSYGAIYKRTIKEGERYVVDTGHIIGFSDSIYYTVKYIGGIKRGKGFVVELEGPGDIFIQTRNQNN